MQPDNGHDQKADCSSSYLISRSQAPRGRWRLQDAKAHLGELVRLANRYQHFTAAHHRPVRAGQDRTVHPSLVYREFGMTMVEAPTVEHEQVIARHRAGKGAPGAAGDAS